MSDALIGKQLSGLKESERFPTTYRETDFDSKEEDANLFKPKQIQTH